MSEGVEQHQSACGVVLGQKTRIKGRGGPAAAFPLGERSFDLPIGRFINVGHKQWSF